MADAAKILDVIAGYDPKDDMTVLSVGRRPSRPYASFATAQRLDGLRIGVVREYLNKTLFSKADEQSIDLVDRAIADLRTLGATVIDPGPAGSLFQTCVAISAPRLLNASFTRQFRDVFPFDDAGQPSGDHIAKLLELAADPSRVPEGLSLRSLGGFGAPGEDRFMMNNYLRERGDANIKSNADLAAKATFYPIRTSPIADSLASTRSARRCSTPRRACRRATRCRSCCWSACRSSVWMRWSRRRQPFHRAS